MKYCVKCGAELTDDAVFCSKCGAMTAEPPRAKAPVRESGLTLAAKVLMILGTVFMGVAIIPLAWCIPMTVSYCRKIKNGEPVSIAFKVCSLLFVSLAGGILMLCDQDH